jgi:redox-sensitive bicupin YhaK (pirin superfamily)
MTAALEEHARGDAESASIELVIQERPRHIDGLAIRRCLPSPRRRRIGPFVFFDHIGPADLPAGTGLDVRPHDEHEERAIYVVEGTIGCDGCVLTPGTMAVLRPGAKVEIAAEQASRVMLLGGAKLAGERYLEWNFVSSSKERIERAKLDWRYGRFPKVPGDEIEFIPLPESSSMTE